MQIFHSKVFHLCIILIIIVAIMFTALIIVLKYGENGETNMPFDVSKISIISTIDAQDVENAKETWNMKVNQNNDIYIYIEKNKNHKKTETIKNITINNIRVDKQPQKGTIITYRPSLANENDIITSAKEYEATDITFNGDKSTNMKDLKISNQGGIIAFRCANSNIGTYISNEAKEEIPYNELLKKIGVNNEELKATVNFDMTIELNSEISFKAEFSVDIPVDDIVSQGETSKEITDLSDVVFKRIEN